MEGSITARPLDYFALLVGASIVALFSGVVATLCARFEGSIRLWFCTGRRILLGEVAVKSGISICPGPHGPY
jgi:hypothetical protein